MSDLSEDSPPVDVSMLIVPLKHSQHYSGAANLLVPPPHRTFSIIPVERSPVLKSGSFSQRGFSLIAGSTEVMFIIIYSIK